jgi:hypothetical protein
MHTLVPGRFTLEKAPASLKLRHATYARTCLVSEVRIIILPDELLSLPRTRESIFATGVNQRPWMPAFAGMTRFLWPTFFNGFPTQDTSSADAFPVLIARRHHRLGSGAIRIEKEADKLKASARAICGGKVQREFFKFESPTACRRHGGGVITSCPPLGKGRKAFPLLTKGLSPARAQPRA